MAGQRKPTGPVKSTGVGTATDMAVYSLTARRPEPFVNSVLRIMDEGPPPMRNLRPAQKIRNGADQFYAEHHAEYEARGKQSDDKIGRVLTHNNACPKMYDELNKRRSTANPTLFIGSQKSSTENFGQTCRLSAKIRPEIDGRKKRTPKPRQRNYMTRSKPRITRSKIAKPRKPQQKNRRVSRYKLSKLWTNKGCQCPSYFRTSEIKSMSTFNDKASMAARDFKMAENNCAGNENVNVNNQQVQPFQTPIKPVKKKSKSDIDSENPESSRPSVSSYDSYMSMDHEPMVEE